MKHTKAPFLFSLLLILILVCGVGASRPIKTGLNLTTDCAGECKESYDEAVKQCNDLSGMRAERCQTMAKKRYDSCLEKCKGGNSPSPGVVRDFD